MYKHSKGINFNLVTMLLLRSLMLISCNLPFALGDQIGKNNKSAKDDLTDAKVVTSDHSKSKTAILSYKNTDQSAQLDHRTTTKDFTSLITSIPMDMSYSNSLSSDISRQP